jgi:hypothetical protein
MHSERNRTIKDTKRAKCGVWVASPLQGEGEGEGFSVHIEIFLRKLDRAFVVYSVVSTR